MDALFKKNKKSKQIKKADKPAPEVKKTKTSKSSDQKKSKGVTDTPKAPAARKYTKEGFKIYTTEELKVGQGGDTPDCPFDCDCCFWNTNDKFILAVSLNDHKKMDWGMSVW